MAVKRRADFAENRVRILEAADEIFVERGVGAPLDSIAQRAGVGRATFFRHFPDRRALINEMLDLFLSKLEETSSKLDVTETSINEITPMFYDQMIHYAPVADFLRAQSREDPVLLEAIDRFHALLRPHVQAAISAGTVREDLREADIVIFAVMLAAAATTPNIGPEGRRAAYDLMMRGLQNRAEAPNLRCDRLTHRSFVITTSRGVITSCAILGHFIGNTENTFHGGSRGCM